MTGIVSGTRQRGRPTSGHRMNRLYRHLHMNYSEGKKVAAEGEEQNVMEIGEAMLS